MMTEDTDVAPDRLNLESAPEIDDLLEAAPRVEPPLSVSVASRVRGFRGNCHSFVLSIL